MKKYSILLFLLLAIIIAVTVLVTSPEFYDSYPVNPRPMGVATSSLIDVIQEDAEMAKLNLMISKNKLQPTIASTLGPVFIIPQPDMPNHFVSVKYPNKQYISYKTTHI